MTLAWSKNKKGAALVYAIMVLLLLATVIVALTALSTASYTDAVLAASDDQSYYYAKSIGLAVKEQFKDGYNIARILTELDRQEADLASNGASSSYQDPKVTGSFTIADENGDLVTGTVQIRYARDEDNNVNNHVIEVRAACVVNNSPAIVTSIFSCEDETGDELDYLTDALVDYDVILTDTNNLTFDFSQASDSSSSALSVYVYAGEDDNVSNPKFSLRVNMGGKLTTTGKTVISGEDSTGKNAEYHSITGNLTAYGDITLNNVGVDGANGVHCDGNVVLSGLGFVKNNIYARGTVTVNAVSTELNWSYVSSYPDSSGGGVTDVAEPNGWSNYHSAKNIYAQGNVTIGARAWVTGNIYSHGSVVVDGKGAVANWQPGGYQLLYHAGNTMIGSSDSSTGNIYSEGSVYIRNGAIVRKSIYANGDVYIENGATVVGNVYSVNGSVTVAGGMVGGGVNCPNGKLTLNNSSKEQYCYYLAESDRDPYGRIIFGGIGVFQPNNTVYKHTCNKFQSSDCEWMSQIRGNLYVENPTTGDYTPLLSIWAHNSIYLKNSTARFTTASNSHTGRTFYGKNGAGNPYTYIVELNQNRDFYDTSKTYIRMFGAHILTLNLGETNNFFYDGYLFDGWIGNVNGRCLYFADMQMDGYVFASQFVYIWGTGPANDYSGANYNRAPNSVNMAYTYAKNGTPGNGITTMPYYCTIEVACNRPSYKGVCSEDRSGFILGDYTEMYCLINVGAEGTENNNSMVQLGVGATSGDAKFYGGINAYVKDFVIQKGARLSTKKASTDSGTLYAATILAEVFNQFTVESSTTSGQYRWGSWIQVKGNASVSGYVYDFDHFARDDGTGTFTNADSARIKGVFKSAGTVLNIKGTQSFNEVQATSTSSVTTLKGSLTVNTLRLNGSLKLDNTGYTLTVKGDMYVGSMTTAFKSSVKVTGNMTVNSSTVTNLDPERLFDIGGNLYIGKNNLKLNSASYTQKVGGIVELGNGNLTLTGGATIGGAKTASTKTLNIVSGYLRGDFDVGHLTFGAGEIYTGGSSRIYGKVAGVFTHSGGTMKNADVTVNGSGAGNEATPAVVINGTAQGDYNYIIAPNGGASVSGGSAIRYIRGGLITKKDTLVSGNFECGISVNNGNLTIGTTTKTLEDQYQVGGAFKGTAPDRDDWRVLYAQKNIYWRYNAKAMTTKGTYDGDWTHLTAGGDITLGYSDYHVTGRFGQICSGGAATLYVQMADAVVAKKTTHIYIEKYLGASPNNSSYGARIENSGADLYIHPKTGSKDTARQGAVGEYIRGDIQVNGILHIVDKNINAEGCKISCRDIDSLSRIHDVDGAKPISIYLTAPTTESDGYYKLTSSIAGAFSVATNLKYDPPVSVGGELYVNGLFKYDGRYDDLQCNGGLYCKNDKVNITSAFKGNVHLPNVTELKLNADIGVNAPKVTKFELNIDITHSLNLASCESLTVASGRKVSGSVIIKTTGKIVNNGTIGESVDCGVYEGSGTVGGNLVTRSSGVTNKITGSGKVTGHIWTNGNLDIDTTNTLGKKGSYIYAKGNITIKNAKFYYKSASDQMDYILTTGGDITLTNCAGNVPKVWNMKGGITITNDSESQRATIASILSYGSYIWLGTKTGNNYQTVTGDLEWHGTYKAGTISGKNYAIDFWGGSGRTIINGSLKAYGTGNVHTSDATIKSVSHFRNTGTVESNASGVYEKKVLVNLSDAITVTKFLMKAKFQDDIVIYGKSDTTEIVFEGTVGSTTGNFIHIHTAKSLTIKAEVKGSVHAASVKTASLEKNCAGSFTITYGTLTTKETDGTIGGNLRAYDAELHINANVGGAVTHTAHAISSSYPIKKVVLGSQKHAITVGGNITVHGRLVDSSKQTKSAVINCKGTYYADLLKDFTNCTALNFTSEANGNCVIVGNQTSNKKIGATMNILGRLFVYSVWNEAKQSESNKGYYQVIFNGVVKANALIVNSKPAEAMDDNSTGDDERYLSACPVRKVIKYTKSANASKAWGEDDHAWMEDLSDSNPRGLSSPRACPATWGDIYYDAIETATGKDYVVFNKPVYVTIPNRDDLVNVLTAGGSTVYYGTVHASHTKWGAGSTLYSDGQVSMSYCILYSKGWTDENNHCMTYSDPYGGKNTFWDTSKANLDMDGSMFVHAYDGMGNNYFDNVTTKSNFSIYVGNTYVTGASEFKGCTYSTGKGQNGNVYTVLMFFGASLFLDGTSHIKTAKDRDVDIPSGRTIVWVNSGTLYVGGDAYIGYKKYGRKTSDDDLCRNGVSFQPGIFVSDTGGGSVSYDGTSYEKGTACVKGSVSVDIYAYRNIRVYKNGVVNSRNSDGNNKYWAGLFISKGSVLLQNSDGSWTDSKKTSNPNSPGGWFGYFDAKGGRKFYTANDGSGVSDATAYVPYGGKYSETVNKTWGGSTADKNLWFYTPLWDAPPQLNVANQTVSGYRYDYLPTGVTASTTSTSGVSVTDQAVSVSETAEKDAPTMPTVSATGGLNTNGDASVNHLKVAHATEADSDWKLTHESKSVAANKAGKAADVAYYGGKANAYTIYWTSPFYNPTMSFTRPSSQWTSSVTKHFDKTQTAYWNTRYIPYVWKLPFYDGSGNSTYAKKVLKAADSVELNGEMILKQTSTTGYYTNQSQYTGSSLAAKASSIFGWRSNGVANKAALYDFVVLNGYPEWDGPFDKDPDHKRRTKILVFESGELPYSAFFMGSGTGSEDFASWYGNDNNKTIRTSKQKAWKLGDPDVSFYDGSLVFYTCADPSNPYGSAAKDLHVVLPQGIGFDFVVDAENTVTVVGKGRVFLYLTSGNTIYFRAKATDKVYANPVGGLKQNSDGTYSPLLYIIGAGTNIDLYLDRMPLGAFVYMPFGSTASLYDSSNGTLKQYNQFKNVNGSTFFSGYSGTGQTTTVGRNTIHMLWDSSSGGARNIWGTIVADRFDYTATAHSLNFKNYEDSARTKRKIVPDFTDTRIYDRSTKDGTSTKLGSYKTYSLSTFLTNAPNYSTSLLNWEYKGIKVEG